MADGTGESTHTPLYLGSEAAADCARHGEMVCQYVPVVVVAGRVRAARNGVALYACPECCIDLFAIAGEPNTDPERAIRFFWKRYVEDDWATLEALFVTVESRYTDAPLR
ncbi:MAG TPA: hypothetical protein VFJ06_00670 [Halococcus sp.]|nr:hypothetical protein [Halococcus sp.]